MGVVGQAIIEGLRESGYEVLPYDRYKTGSVPLDSVVKRELVFICIPTPSKPSGEIDLSEIEWFFKEISKSNLEAGTLVIKSTVVPGTTQHFQELYPQFSILYSPEFLDSRTAKYDFLHPENTIIGYTGSRNPDFLLRLVGVYLDLGSMPKIVKSEEAELAKYMVNAYYATRVIFANQIFDLAQSLGIDYSKVRYLFEGDKRVEPGHFEPYKDGYRGFGGSCLPKDLEALLYLSKSREVDLPLLDTVKQLNIEYRSGTGS